MRGLGLIIAIVAMPAPAAEAVTPSSEMAKALADFATLPPIEANYFRYLTTYAFPEEVRRDAEKIQAFWVNSLSSKSKIVAPLKLTDTLYRIDLRDYGWDPYAWAKVTSRDPYYRIENSLLVRTDWFLTETSDGNRSPAYYELLYGLGKEPKNLDEFRSRWGVDRKAAEKFETIRAANVDEGDSIVALHNRLINRQSISTSAIGGSHWESIDFLDGSGARDITEDLFPQKFDAQEIITTLPNGLQTYLLVNGQGKRVEFADPFIAKDSFNHRGAAVQNPVSCVRCHSKSDGYFPPISDLPEALKQGLDLKAYDKATKDRIETFYLTENLAAGRIIASDQANYAHAVSSTNGLDPRPNGEKWAQLLRWYDAKVDLTQAARELGVTPERLIEAAKLSTKRRIAGLAARDPQAVPRAAWEKDDYPQLQVLLQLK